MLSVLLVFALFTCAYPATLTISWDAYTNVDTTKHFSIDRSTDFINSTSVITGLSISSTSYTDTVTDTTLTYCYRVKVTDSTNVILSTSSAICMQPRNQSLPNVQALVASPPYLVADPTVISKGSTTNYVYFMWAGVTSPSVKDWVELFVTGAPDNTYLVFLYVSGLAKGQNRLRVPAAIAVGDYELRYYRNDSFNRLLTSNIFTVGN